MDATCPNKNCPSHTSGPAPSLSAMGGGTTSVTASDLARWEAGEGGGALPGFMPVPDYNLLLSLSDCTGELEGVWLGGQAARDLLGDMVCPYVHIHTLY